MHRARSRLLCIGFFFQFNQCSSQLDCPPRLVAVSVGQGVDELQASLNVPLLGDGGSKRWACGEIFEGYVEFIQVACIDGTISVDSSRCTPSGCNAGMQTLATIGRQNTTAYVTLPVPLRHDEIYSIHCSRALEGYMESIKLRCVRGNLISDASFCRLPFGEARSVWRLSNGDYLPGTWRVFEVSFHTDPDCNTPRLQGEPVAASEDPSIDAWKRLAFDRDYDTAWSPHCVYGCQPGAAWIGLHLPAPSEYVRCVQLRQSLVSCCSSKDVHLDVWDGEQFQTLQRWDTTGLKRITHSIELKVPISCLEGRPEGEGILHDCTGPPVVGLQEGDTCVATCDEQTHYGSPATFKCESDGRLAGDTPTCYRLQTLVRAALFITLVVGVFFFAWQYKFWCMISKMRLSDDDVGIPRAMKKKWLEHGGRNIWDVLEKELKSGTSLTADLFGKKDEEAGFVLSPKAGGSEAGGHDHGDALATEDDKTDAALEQMAEMVMVKGRLKVAAPSTDGLCTPCVDPDLCWSCCLCPLCRIADTWHTLGAPRFFSYGKIFCLYLLCPCIWPCLNFFNRLRIRMIFDIPLEPHRDCLIHCCCCCCCAPFAICQEARLVDAPAKLCYARKKQKELFEKREEEDD